MKKLLVALSPALVLAATLVAVVLLSSGGAERSGAAAEPAGPTGTGSTLDGPTGAVPTGAGPTGTGAAGAGPPPRSFRPVPAPAASAHGSYRVPGLGARKTAVLAAGGDSLDLAVAMLETEDMSTGYAYGDGKRGDAANFGIFKQNWHMIRQADPRFAGLTPADQDRGAALDTDLRLDVEVLHASQRRWGIDAWFAGHRGGESGLLARGSADLVAYEDAVRWIQQQIDADPAHLRDDTRFWVDVPAV